MQSFSDSLLAYDQFEFSPASTLVEEGDSFSILYVNSVCGLSLPSTSDSSGWNGWHHGTYSTGLPIPDTVFTCHPVDHETSCAETLEHGGDLAYAFGLDLGFVPSTSSVYSTSPPDILYPDYMGATLYPAHSPETSDPALYVNPSVLSGSDTAPFASSAVVQPSSVFAHDDNSESSTDDEYMPPTPTRPTKRRFSPYSTEPPPTRSRKTSPSRSPPPRKTAARKRTPRRNVQVQLLPAEFEQALRDGACACPATNCDFIPSGRRGADLRRHMITHCPEITSQEWVCCGVLLSDAHAYGIPDGSPVYEYKGIQLVGGCMGDFSRKDALKRHLENEKCRCRCDRNLAQLLGRLPNPSQDTAPYF